MIHLHTIRRTSSFEGSLVTKHKVNSDFMRTPYWFHSTNYILVSAAYALYRFRPTTSIKRARTALYLVNPIKAAYFSNI
jgi:hypothetical protein